MMDLQKYQWRCDNCCSIYGENDDPIMRIHTNGAQWPAYGKCNRCDKEYWEDDFKKLCEKLMMFR